MQKYHLFIGIEMSSPVGPPGKTMGCLIPIGIFLELASLTTYFNCKI